MKLIRLTMFSGKILIGFWILDVVIAEWPLNTIKVMPSTHEFFPDIIRKNVSKLKTNIMAEHKGTFYTLCVLHCAETRFCVAINFKEKAEENENNCQLTNTTEQKFDENAPEEEKVWTFRRINVDRSLAAACRGETNECYNGGTMIWDPTKTFSCLCKEGYKGELCKKDIDECAKGSNTCDANANCTNTNGSFKCNCKNGFSGNGQTCTDIDECSEGSHTCDKTANCTNTNGSFKCECKKNGFSWNGHTCTDIDECSEASHECHPNATCNNTQGSYNCRCLRGYVGNGKYCQNLKDLSEILKNEPIEFDYKLIEWLPTGNGTGNWSICWRATKDGWNASIFHSNCDGKKPTLTIIQVVKNNKTYVFGGYATESWEDPGVWRGRWASAPGSFMFSLRNNDDLGPFTAPLKNKYDPKAIFRENSRGPCFDDMCLYGNARLNTKSWADLGDRYQAPPGYTHGELKTESLVAGSHHFTPSEVEVLYLN